MEHTREQFTFFITLESKYLNQFELLSTISEELKKGGYVDENYSSEIINREKEFPTGLKTRYCNVAIPHTDASFVYKPFIYFMRVKNEINFFEMSGMGLSLPIKFILILGISDRVNQMAVLREVMFMLKDDEKMLRLLNSTSMQEIENILLEVIGGRDE